MQTDIKKINTKTLQDILNACEKSFSTELNVSDFYGEGQTTWSIPEIGLAYKNTSSKKDLLLFVENLTETNSVRQAYAKIYEEVQARSSTTTELPEYKAQNTTVTPGLEEKIEDYEKIRKQKADIRETSDKAVQDALKRKQELIDKKIQEAINNKKIVVIPVGELKNVELTNGEKETILTFSKVAKEDPATLEQFIETKIKESLATVTDEYKENITPEIITKSATSITENFIALPNYQTITEIPTKIPVMHPASPFVALTLLNDAKLKGILTDEEVRNKVAEMSQVLALGIEAEANVNFAGVNAVFGKNISSVFYGPADRSITQFEVAEDQEGQRDNGVELSVSDVYDNGKKFYDFYEKIKGARTAQEVASTSMVYVPSYSQASYAGTATKTASVLTKALPAVGAVYGFKQGVLLSQWARSGQPLLSAGNQNLVRLLTSNAGVQEIASASLVSFSRPVGFQFGKFSIAITTGSNQSAGTQIAVGGIKFGEKWAGAIAVKGGTQVAVVAGTQAGGQLAVGTSTFLTKALTLLGGLSSWATAGLSLIGGYLFGKLLEKVNWAKVKKFMGEYVLPVAVGGGLVMFGAPVAGLVAGGLLFGVARGATLASITAGAFGVLGFIGSSIGIAIATPVIITILVIPPLVAFIMLVINNSAYVVPPSISTTGADNPYMLVTKTANPSKATNPTNNKTTVAYTVEIRALKSPLTNLRLVDAECNVIKKNNAKINCPPEDIPEFEADLSISPTSSYSFTFFVNYDSGYSDALVFDTITIAADTIEESNIVTEGSASVCFGECPQNCAKVEDFGDPWPTGLKNNANIALADISKYQGFTAKLCPNNEPVNLCYKPSRIKEGYYAWHVSNSYGDNCDVYFNSKGLGSPSDASFIITHELTHHIQSIKGIETTKYETSGGFDEVRNGGFCTYEDTAGSKTESMAEAAALYVNSTPSWSACAGNYSTKYPRNFSWAQKFMTQ
jgi:hypothetical protein